MKKLLKIGMALLSIVMLLFACSKENDALADLDADVRVLYSKTADVFVKSIGATELTSQQKNDVITKSYRFLASLNAKTEQTNPATESKFISYYTIMPIALKISENESISLSIAHLSANSKANDGYMVFVNDSRIPYPLAYSDTGNWDLTQDENLQNFILGWFQVHITEEVKNAEETKEKPLTKGSSDDCPWTITSSVSGILASAYCLSGVTWAQIGTPYCWNTPSMYPAGCTAVALAHVMAYHQHPTVGIEVDRHIGASGPFTTPHSYNWSWMKSQAKASTFSIFITEERDAMFDIANLMSEIGWHAPLTYISSSMTSGTTMGAANALSAMGYTSTYYNGYNFTAITNSLDANKPVYVGGFPPVGSYGHDWTIEGYASHYQRNYYEQLQENCPYVISQQFGYEEWNYWNYVWCNWGAEGVGNGNYYSGIFTPVIGGTSYNFSCDIEMLVNITPI